MIRGLAQNNVQANASEHGPKAPAHQEREPLPGARLRRDLRVLQRLTHAGTFLRAGRRPSVRNRRNQPTGRAGNRTIEPRFKKGDNRC